MRASWQLEFCRSRFRGPSAIDWMKFDIEERAGDRFVSKKIVSTEGERGKAIVIADLVGQASLVVVVGELVVGGDQGE